MTTDSAVRSVADLAARIDSIPRTLSVAAGVALPEVNELRAGPRASIVTTGIGASEGPARLLACTLQEEGIAARFVPLSSFGLGAIEGSLLVAFSQNLSPNARLAFEPRHRFRTRWLVTSVGFAAGASEREPVVEELRRSGVVVVVAPPGREEGSLVRVVGPTVASLVALRLAEAIGARSLAGLDFTEAAHAYESPIAPIAFAPGDLAIVTAGVALDAVHGHRWKLLEALLRSDPSVWDVLQVAHGPLQAIHGRPLELVVLATERGRPMVARLASTLASSRCRLMPIVARRDSPLAFFEHAAAIDACILATLRLSPVDLGEWPGRGEDAPLYGLGDP